MREALRQALKVITKPNQAAKELHKQTLEEMVKHYLQLVIAVGVAAGVFSFVFSIGRSVYYDLFLHVQVQYLRLIIYQLGQVVSIIIFALFAGTFFMFFVSIILEIFLRIKYAHLFKLLFTAASPLLLFGWLPYVQAGLVVWSAAIFVIAYKEGTQTTIKKQSIEQRD